MSNQLKDTIENEKPKPKVLNSKIVFEGFFDVYEDTLLLPPDYQKEYKYFKIEENSAVSIIAITKQEEIIFLNEYRHPTGEYVLGFPGGLIEKNEDILESSKRELLEETGYTSDIKNFKILGSSYQSPAISKLKIHHILVTDCEKVSKQQLESSEILEMKVIKKEGFYKLVKSSNNVDGCLLTTLFYYEHQ